MESQHMTQQAFSQYTGISSSVLSGIFTGRTKPTLKQVEAICNKISNINLYWLLKGEGSMYISDQQSKNADGENASSPTLLGDNEAGSDNKMGLTAIAAAKVNGKNVSGTSMKNLNILKRKITEIRVFYDDNTYEAFVPKQI